MMLDQLSKSGNMMYFSLKNVMNVPIVEERLNTCQNTLFPIISAQQII